jgi:hypothetical protein
MKVPPTETKAGKLIVLREFALKVLPANVKAPPTETKAGKLRLVREFMLVLAADKKDEPIEARLGKLTLVREFIEPFKGEKVKPTEVRTGKLRLVNLLKLLIVKESLTPTIFVEDKDVRLSKFKLLFPAITRLVIHFPYLRAAA